MYWTYTPRVRSDEKLTRVERVGEREREFWVYSIGRFARDVSLTVCMEKEKRAVKKK